MNKSLRRKCGTNVGHAELVAMVRTLLETVLDTLLQDDTPVVSWVGPCRPQPCASLCCLARMLTVRKKTPREK